MVMADCSYTKVAVMQLFYELKEKFPTIPDHVVSDFMYQTAFDRHECERKLSEEHRRFELHSYPTSIADRMIQGKGRPRTLPISRSEYNSPRLLKPGRRLPFVLEDNNWDWQRTSKQSRVADSKSLCRDKLQTELSNTCKPVQKNEIIGGLNLFAQNDICGSERRTSLYAICDKKYRVNGSHSAPTTPFQKSPSSDIEDVVTRKHRSSLNVDCSAAVSPSVTEIKRPFTKVLLTLRPPSSEAQPVISIAADSSQLMYQSTSSLTEQGYKNQFQININEEGHPTLTASRLKIYNNTIPNICCGGLPCSGEISSLLPVFDKALTPTLKLRLREQKERKERLEIELNRRKRRLLQLQQEILAMEKDLERRKKTPMKSEKVLRLQEEVSALQNDCQKMLFESESRDHPVAFLTSGREGNDSESSWMCTMCTFINHKMLPKCEQCDMVRVNSKNSLSSILRPPSTSTQLPPIYP